ncbi:glutaredoxin-related protein 5, mitochondrial-like [Lineus longissimus]|uniref:glutaredoxin-related protein 5, mitochondrial-like n=1 Tax=Lineus longissimus TaxID=88925 RepID=UPI00315C5BD2
MALLRSISKLDLRYSLSRVISATYCTNPNVKERIEGIVKGSKVVVFMKGTPDAPRCGFSNGVVQILKFHGVENFDAHNVLDDDDIRQGIKDYSSWPTIPQIYLDGEFLGGCDIMLEMHKSGDLIEELKKVGIRSALLDIEKKNTDS